MRRKLTLETKNPWSGPAFLNFLKMYPDGKIMVIARDPRDVVNSFRKITIAPGHDYLIALFNAIDIVDKGLEYSQKFPGNVHFLTFENLKLNTEGEARKNNRLSRIGFRRPNA